MDCSLERTMSARLALFIIPDWLSSKMESDSATRAAPFASVHITEREPSKGEETESDGNADLVHAEFPRYVATAVR